MFEELVSQYFQLCETCNASVKGDFLAGYHDRISPKVDELLQGFHKLSSLLAEAKEYTLPESVKQSCFAAVVGTIGGQGHTPRSLYELGLSELRKAEDEMYEIIANLRGLPKTASYETKLQTIDLFMADSAEDSKQKLNDDPSLYARTAQNIIDRSQRLLPQVSFYMVHSPKLHDENSESGYGVDAYYNPNSGMVFINSYYPTVLPSLASLMIHEGVPGHHLFIRASKPKEKKILFEASYKSQELIEGWAFYMEEFANELGFYNQEERMWSLNLIRMRALRLITPYHFFVDNWSSAQVKDFYRKHLSSTEYTMESEIRRALNWRGQGFTYMVGKEMIKKLRLKSERVLGDNFSVLEFHDFILGLHGNVHPKTLEALHAQWLEDKVSEVDDRGARIK